MHAVLVTYENDTPADQAKRHPDNIGFAKELTKVPGLVMKTWINDRATYGGFYVFTGKAAAESFINGEMFQSAVPKDPSNRNVQPESGVKTIKLADARCGRTHAGLQLDLEAPVETSVSVHG